MRKLVGLIGVATLMGGCAQLQTPQAGLSDLRFDKAEIQYHQNTPDNEVRAAANRACALHGREALKAGELCRDAACINRTAIFACIEVK